MTRTIPGHVDSTGKLINRIALLAKETVIYQGKPLFAERQLPGGKYEKYQIQPPHKVSIAPSMLRNFTCVAGCTACCLPFTLDFTPEEFDTLDWLPEISGQAIRDFNMRMIEVNGVRKEVFTYEQYKDPSCPYLRPTREGGALGCGFWTETNSTQPLECAAAPQLLMTTRGKGHTVIMKRPFGRGWAWKDRPQCEFDPVYDKISNIPDDYDLTDEINLLKRYYAWSQHLGVETWFPEVIEAMENLPDLLKKSGLTSVIVIEA